jgi:threonine dehydratase
MLAGHVSLRGQSAVLVLSGGNVDLPVLQSVMA